MPTIASRPQHDTLTKPYNPARRKPDYRCTVTEYCYCRRSERPDTARHLLDWDAFMSSRKSLTNRRAVLAGAVLCLTGIVVFVGNTTLETRTEERVAAVARCRLQPSGKVTASLAGPFAGIRALSGHVDSVTIHATEVRRHDMDLDVEAAVQDIDSDGTSGKGSVAVVAPYSQLAARFARQKDARSLTVGRDAQGLILSTTSEQGMPIKVHSSLQATDNSITVTPVDVTVFGRSIPVEKLSSFTTSKMTDELKPRTVKIADLPAGSQITAVDAAPQGLRLKIDLPEKSAPNRCTSN
ncbi:LmeA family phospholipid-binding protein [Streptomyces sp. NPDC055085]